MSAVVRSDRSSPTRPSPAVPVLHYAGHLQVVSSSPGLPRRLKVLLLFRRLSTPIAICLVIGVLPIYGWSVFTQRSWGQRWQHLQNLRQDERHLVNETETRNHDITAKVQANPVGFVPLSPQNTVFLKPQPPQPVLRHGSSGAFPDLKIDLDTPLAY